MGQWQEAEKHAEKALEMYERGRWSEAENELRKALQIDPDQGDWHFNLGLTLERTGRDAEALVCFENAARLLPDSIDSKLAIGTVCLRLERFAESEQQLERVLTFEPKIENAWAMLIDVQAAQGKHDSAATTFYLAQDALDHQSASVLVAMSCSLSTQNEGERALWCAREAIKIDSMVPGGRLQLANALLALGKGQEASQMLLQELREDPGNVQALLLHADVLAETGRINEAIIKLHRVLELEPANVEAHIRAGQYAMAGNRWEEAFVAWGLVRRLCPDHPSACLYLAQSLIAMERHQAAKPLLHEYITRLPETVGINHRLHVAELMLSAGDSSATISLLSPLSTQKTLSTEVKITLLRLLAVAYFANGDTERGAATSRKVLRLDPNCTASSHNLALAAMKNHRYRIAWVWINRGLKVDAHDEELRRIRSKLIWTLLGLFLRRLIGRS